MKTQAELYAGRIKDEAAENTLDIVVNVMQRQFQASGFIARLAEYAAVNGESAAAQKATNQLKSMILASETEKSARKWAEKNNPGEANYTTRQLVDFLSRCDERGKEIWLGRGWSKIWERIDEIVEDEEESP